MKSNNQHPERFTNAVVKLYNAYHSGTLNAFDCTACAVGNICDNSDEWMNYTGNAVTVDSERIVRTIYAEPRTRKFYLNNGYDQDELYEVERLFLSHFINQSHDSGNTNKESQFKGLCAVVEYLCELDNIPNVMDYTKLFESENEKPKYELQIN